MTEETGEHFLALLRKEPVLEATPESEEIRELKSAQITWEQADSADALVFDAPPSACYAEQDTPPIIGRDDEIAELAGLLETHQWVTVFGTPGIGKTTVVGQVVSEHRSSGRFCPIIFVDCQQHGVTSKGALLDTLRRQIAGESSEEKDIAKILEAAWKKEFLLVIDGLDAAYSDQEGSRIAIADLLDVVAANLTTRQRLLVTSRSCLGGSLEQPFELTPLSSAHVLDLFHHQYAYCRRDVPVDIDVRARNLVEKLGGLPLAVILAARWWSQADDTTTSSMDDSCPIGRGGKYNKIIKLWIRKAYSLLPAASEASRLFRWMSLFPAGMSKECQRELFKNLTEETRQNLRQLCLIYEEEGGCLTMLQPIRNVANRYLTGEEKKRAHEEVARYFLSIAQKETEQLRREARIRATARLKKELANIHAAMDRAYADGQNELVIDFAQALGKFYLWCNVDEGIERLQQGECAAERAGNMDALCEILLFQGDLLRRLREFTKAYAAFDRAEALYEQRQNSLGRARCLLGKAHVFRRQDRYAAALELYEAALRLFNGDVVGTSNVYKGMADVYRKLDKLSEATHFLKEAQEIYRDQGNLLGLANTLRAMAEVRRHMADYEKARQIFHEAIGIYHELGASMGMAQCIRGLADLYWLQDYDTAARDCYRRANILAREIGDRLCIARVIYGLGQLYRRSGELEDALGQFREAEVEYITIGSRLGIARSIRGKGDVYLKQERLDLALAAYQQAYKISCEIASRQVEAESLRGMGEVYRRQERYDLALRRFHEAGAIYQLIGARLGVHHAMKGCGNVHLSCHDVEQAIAYYVPAKTFYEESGNIRAAADVAESLSRAYEALGQSERAAEVREEGRRLRDEVERRGRVALTTKEGSGVLPGAVERIG